MTCEIEVDISIESNDWNESFEDISQFIDHHSKLILKLTDITKHTKYLELSIVLCDDDFITGLNKQYRNQDKPTNVLSFEADNLIAGNYVNCSTNIILGDVVIAFETIKSFLRIGTSTFCLA